MLDDEVSDQEDSDSHYYHCYQSHHNSYHCHCTIHWIIYLSCNRDVKYFKFHELARLRILFHIYTQ